uniref:Uncharacterized protein n=1 Tax=Candidatus Kentrum sp. DK TaxID=2126562 RepID=A0A450S0D8_9GAMM|nr:MAG: hypothetical protein BECKDK2373B_GA0170837_100916 [Candidatus Kentron sp. DK]
MNTTHLSRDSIVDEIHAVRERLAKQYRNDLAAYSQAAESHCRALGFDLVETAHPHSVRKYPEETVAEAQ